MVNHSCSGEHQIGNTTKTLDLEKFYPQDTNKNYNGLKFLWTCIKKVSCFFLGLGVQKNNINSDA